MEKKLAISCSAFALAILLSACQPEESDEAASLTASDDSQAGAAAAAIEHDLRPLPGLEGQVPEITQRTTVSLQTSAGEVLIEIYPQAAPNAAARFIELVETGFYDETPISRVVPGFVAQFGVNWREPHRDWQQDNFNDDPTLFSLDRGTLAFAKAGPDSNSTQVFINYVENNRLAAPEYNFTVFGKVVGGMEVVDSFAQVGDPNGGLNQERLWNDGAAYLASLDEQPTMIERAEVVD